LNWSQVHYSQIEDRQKLHRGIVRDLERQHAKQTANLHNLVQQESILRNCFGRN
jgi:hypothetical protein